MDLVMVHIALVLTWWMSDVEIHRFCLGDMVELVMVLNVVFKFVLWSHMVILMTAKTHLTINEVGGKIVCYHCGHTIKYL